MVQLLKSKPCQLRKVVACSQSSYLDRASAFKNKQADFTTTLVWMEYIEYKLGYLVLFGIFLPASSLERDSSHSSYISFYPSCQVQVFKMPATKFLLKILHLWSQMSGSIFLIQNKKLFIINYYCQSMKINSNANYKVTLVLLPPARFWV